MVAKSRVRGGLRLDAHKERSTLRPLRAARPSETLVLPLDQHAGMAAKPIVRAAERVLAGQPIAQPDGEVSAWLHSPVSGTVLAIEPRPAPHHIAGPALSIVIANDGRDERFEPAHSIPSFEQMSPQQLCEYIGQGGIVGLGGAAFPTLAKVLSANAKNAPRLVLNGVECEPYISCDDMLMRERADDVVLGARILMHAIGAQICSIAIEDDVPQAEQALRTAIANAHDERIRLDIVPSIYPAGGEKQLIATLFDVEVPANGLPADIGVLCQNVGTAAAVAQWLRDRRPLISRVVTVTGDGVRDACNLDVLLGTLIADLVPQCGGYTERMQRLIMGGSMMGTPLPHDDLPVVKSTNCIVAASTLDLQPRGVEMPCIRCGNCSEVCPAFLLPQQIHLYAQGRDLEGMNRYGLLDCIECGCCDYVCPSQIPLAERFRDSKPLLAAALRDRDDATVARLRYEARAERLERIETQRRAALARKRQELTQKH